MGREVPVGRRNLFSDLRRVAVSLLGVGLAVALLLLIQGLWSGTLERITAYEDNVGAQLFVAEPGTRGFQSDVSAIPAQAESEVGEIPGVVLAQAAWSVAAAVVVAAALTFALASLLARTASAVTLALEPGALVRVTVISIVVGAAASIAPLAKVSRLDPASVFRR